MWGASTGLRTRSKRLVSKLHHLSINKRPILKNQILGEHFHPPRTVNEYKPHGWVTIPMVISKCSALTAYRWTQRSSLQLGLRVDGHLALTDFRPDDPKWTLTYGWRCIDSTINIVLGLIIIIWPKLRHIRNQTAYLITSGIINQGAQNYSKSRTECLDVYFCDPTSISFRLLYETA